MSFGHDDDGLAPYVLSGVQERGRELGRGSYATVLELEYLGLKCAGKKIHDELLGQGGITYAVARFREECRLLSQVRHPNIVQFLGVYFKNEGMAPILVMEFLENNLTSCIDNHGVLPEEITHTILHDVAIGLCYLHGQEPSIIHRDLSANNVLLTPNMNAKISDLGVARIISMSPLQLSRMTQTPGTPAYMPPEVMVANPLYDTSIDSFSFGILCIHSLSGEWPEPQVGPNRIDPDSNRLIPVSEAERRDKLLQRIGQDHPLMELILKCIDNNPRCRPHATEIVHHLATIAAQSTHNSPTNRLELLRQIDIAEEEKRDLMSNQQKQLEQALQMENEISRLGADKLATELHKSQEYSRMELALSSQINQQRLQIDDLTCQIQVLKAHKASLAQTTEKLRAEIEEQTTQISRYKTDIKNTLKSFEERMIKERDRQGEQAAEEKRRYEKLLNEEKLRYDRVCLQNVTLETELHSLRSTEECLRHSLSCKDATIVDRDLELQIKCKALEQNDVTISGMNRQLDEARKLLATTKQSFQGCITWSKCASLMVVASKSSSTLLNGMLYFGGGVTEKQNECNVYCYNPIEDQWTVLPSLSVRNFGLGNIDGKLVSVGGAKKRPSKERTNEVYTFVESIGKWKKTYPPMPTARSSAVVFSLKQALIVGFGYVSPREKHVISSNTIEVFKHSDMLWYTCKPCVQVPISPIDISGVLVYPNIYMMGGIRIGDNHNEVVCISVDDLLQDATPADMVPKTDTNKEQSLWRRLPDTPTNKSAITTLNGSVIALGGEGGLDASSSPIHMYSPTTDSWINIGDLPSPRILTTISALSPNEIIVIRGFDGTKQVNTVYKGTLQLTL